MKSLYLNQEIILPNTKNAENGIFHTSHEALEKALTDLSLKEQHIVYNYEFVKAEKDHAVVLCTISDKNSRRIQSVGESFSGEKNVATDAAKIAFDKAAIAYFSFDGDIILDYTSEKEPVSTSLSERSDIEITAVKEVKDVPPTTNEVKPIENVEVTSATIKVEEENEKNESEKICNTNVQITTEESNCNAETSEIQSEKDDLGEIPITIGKYARSNSVHKIKDLYENDNKWFMYICEKFTTAQNPELLKQADAMREYAKSRN